MNQTSLAPAHRAVQLIGADLTEKSLKLHLEGLAGVDAVGLEAAGGRFGHPLDQDHLEGVGVGQDHLPDRPDHAGGRGHAGQGALPGRQGDQSGSRPIRPPLRWRRCACTATWSRTRWRRSARRTVSDGIHIAAVATAFPSGRASLAVKLADVEDAVRNGADEIDMVIDRGAFLSGRYGGVFDQIVAVKEACRRDDGSYAHLKVILETGELNTYDNVRRASWLAILAGADFIKTSTGKVSPAATLPVTLLMLQVVRDWYRLTGEKIGVKPAGGIRTSKDAIKYLVTVAETVGEEWLQPRPVPVRRVQPAQRRAAAAAEDRPPAITAAPTT